jgi:hypothetical protein
MADLSPAALAVLDAWGNVIRADNYGGRVEVPLAAALSAAADQVVPISDRPDPNIEFEYGQWLSQNTTRGYLLAIAAELRAQ